MKKPPIFRQNDLSHVNIYYGDYEIVYPFGAVSTEKFVLDTGFSILHPIYKYKRVVSLWDPQDLFTTLDSVNAQ